MKMLGGVNIVACRLLLSLTGRCSKSGPSKLSPMSTSLGQAAGC